MLVLRFLFRNVFLGLLTRLLGRALPLLLRLARLLRP
jgi:hypothetical protein